MDYEKPAGRRTQMILEAEAEVQAQARTCMYYVGGLRLLLRLADDIERTMRVLQVVERDMAMMDRSLKPHGSTVTIVALVVVAPCHVLTCDESQVEIVARIASRQAVSWQRRQNDCKEASRSVEEDRMG